MRKLIIATTALAFLSSTAVFAQSPSTPAPAASGDTMSKGDSSKMMKKTSKKKASKMKSDDAK